jgi:hypothetical protein
MNRWPLVNVIVLRKINVQLGLPGKRVNLERMGNPEIEVKE